jgi:cytochrome c biogenesis protein CcmG/thiol:disulfide interchange protein DsbE
VESVGASGEWETARSTIISHRCNKSLLVFMGSVQTGNARVSTIMLRFLASRYFVWFAVLLVALGAAWTIAARVPASEAGDTQMASPREGFPAPNFVLNNFDGESVALDSLRGQVVVLNVWASWCGPCRAEMPALQRVYAANRARGFVVLGVNSTIQDTEANARAFAREMNVSFPLVFDRDGAVTTRYHVQALPTTFILDRRGVIRSLIIGGPLSEATIVSKIETLLAESAP